MDSDGIARLFEKPISRRAALRSGGIGIAASSLAAFGLTGSASAENAGATVAARQQVTPALLQVTPDQVEGALAELDAIVEDARSRSGVPGVAVGVVYKDEVVALKGYGVREAGSPAQVDPDTVFQLASVSKPVASTVVAALVGDGVVGWDSRINELDPRFEMYDPWVTREVTIRDMFSHRSGLPDHAGDTLEDIGYDRAAVLHRLRYQKPASSFRSEYAYTNFGLTAAAVATAKAAGSTWEDISEERLYQPLNMRQTSSRFDHYINSPKRAATHVLVDGQWVAMYVRQPDAQSPAGGVSSTVRDMVQWLRLQLGGGTVDGDEIIDAGALGETHRPQFINGPPADPATDMAGFYGLGWNVSYDGAGAVRLSHSGAFALGAATSIFVLPGSELAIVVLTNAAPIGIAEAISVSFLDLATTGEIHQDYVQLFRDIFAVELAPAYDTDYSNPPESPSPALPSGAYAGVYQNDLYGEIEITEEGGDLSLGLGPEKEPFPIRHYDRDVFLYQPTGENAAGPSGVTFTVGPDRLATSVVIENLNINGQGTFNRPEEDDE